MWSQDIKCFKCLGHEHITFKCPNKRVIIIHGKHRELVSSDEAENEVEDEIGNDKQEEYFESTKGDL